MKATRISGVGLDQISRNEIHGVLASSGYESRGRSMAERFSSTLFHTQPKYSLGFTEYIDNKIRKSNDSAFSLLGYRPRVFGGDDSRSAFRLMTDLIHEIPSKEATILIDISSMTRTWYGGFIKALSRSRHPRLRTLFYYTPSVWSNARPHIAINEVLGPVSGFASCALPNKPTALVMCLGSDADRALGLNEHLDPKVTMCFMTDPSPDPHFTKAVVEANQELLDTIGPNCVFPFSLHDAFGTYKMLESTCNGLARNYRVVAASLGPKVFGLYCFLLHTNLPDISVWRVSPTNKQPPFDHKPGDTPVLLEVTWESQGSD